MYTGDGSGDYYGVLAAKSQQSQPNGDLIAAFEAHLPSSAMQPDTQSVQQPRGDPEYAIEDASPSARQPGNEDMQLQSDIMHVEQQPQRPGSSSLPGQQQVQATEQLLQSNHHQPGQFDGQQAVVDGWQVQPRGQSEEGRPSRQTEKSTGQEKAQQKKKKGPSRQCEGAFEDGQVQGGLGMGQGKTECERVATWGHDKYLVITFTTC